MQCVASPCRAVSPYRAVSLCAAAQFATVPCRATGAASAKGLPPPLPRSTPWPLAADALLSHPAHSGLPYTLPCRPPCSRPSSLPPMLMPKRFGEQLGSPGPARGSPSAATLISAAAVAPPLASPTAQLPVPTAVRLTRSRTAPPTLRMAARIAPSTTVVPARPIPFGTPATDPNFLRRSLAAPWFDASDNVTARVTSWRNKKFDALDVELQRELETGEEADGPMSRLPAMPSSPGLSSAGATAR